MGRLKEAVRRAAPRIKHAHDSWRRGIPLAAIMLRYFAYVLAGTILIAGFVVSFLIWGVASGLLYAANYASIHEEEVADALSSQGSVSADDVPSCYRWGVFDESGAYVAGDFDSALTDEARGFLATGERNAPVSSSFFGTPVYCTAVTLDGGSRCVLAYDFNPDFASKRLRDALPDPQGSVLAAAAIVFVAMMALVSRRAARVIGGKLAPLSDAAARIAARELDFPVTYGTVRETNDALRAIDDMRASLKRSLEEQWDAERAQRDAISSLAHDLKTPLTVVRGNADLLRETSLDAEQQGYASAIARAACELDSFAARIVEASRGNEVGRAGGAMAANELASAIGRDARSVLESQGMRCSVRMQDFGDAHIANADDVKRAAMNLVDNAAAYGLRSGLVEIAFAETLLETHGGMQAPAFAVVVENEGDGFSDEALARATERFYRGDEARPSNGHFGLGLSIVADIARENGAALRIENTDVGARASFLVPFASV